MTRLFGLLLGLFFLSAGLSQAVPNYVIIDNQTGHVLGGSNRDEKVQIASLTKIATAMVALDWAQLNKKDLSAAALISANAMRAGGVNPVGLQEGDSLTIRDLLYCSLMASDNIAATALAEYIGAQLPDSDGLSPIGNFVNQMNALARILEMKRTLFLNPTGADNITDGPLPYSTAADMARLTKYAYSEADFPFYVAQKTRVVHVLRAGADMPIQLTNTNELLGQDGIDGVKTGTTTKAGECLILTTERRPEVQRQGETVFITPRRITVVLLGSRNRFGDGMALINQGWSLYDTWAAAGRKTKGAQSL
jgi:serine-type D-Ala-D-Ala carboxypeptidase (penicillin-binding protein 5/6)